VLGDGAGRTLLINEAVRQIGSARVIEGETGGSPMALPAEMVVRSVEPSEDRAPLPWLGILEAGLLHALILLWLVTDWSRPAPLPPEPRAIPVQLVMAAPPKPPPAPAAAKPTPLNYRESGPDQETRAPPPAEKPAPEAATPPPATPDLANPEKPAPPPPPPEKPTPAGELPNPAAKSAKSVPEKQVARVEPPKKEARTFEAPRLAALRQLNIAPGKHAETGDPYLNRLHALIEQHRIYPRILGQFGLPVEGTAVFDVAVERSGQVIAMRLAQSSGVPGIDKDVETMIRSSLPFPPLPPDYPDRVGIVVTISLFPRS
jgi:periplasmic protein TonB